MHKGSCLCGAVKFEVKGSLSAVEGCHCSMCRKWTGHFLASTEVTRSALTVQDSDSVSLSHSCPLRKYGGVFVQIVELLFSSPFIPFRKKSTTGLVFRWARLINQRINKWRYISFREKGDYYEIRPTGCHKTNIRALTPLEFHHPKTAVHQSWISHSGCSL